jgi:NAD(P)-dependent dehydrogenase (short-subunit alcohol dehydrogenase family)
MRTAIVSGGASGIGEATAQRLARGGAAVAIFDLNGPAAEKTACAIESAGGKAIGLAVDVTDRPGIDVGVEKVRSELGRPTILINSAG